MSNPTSNFGWQMPTNSDLVTDLPADFEVFGQAVDTSLMDLKGGTTGQVLSKASNTDMDFTWVAQDDSNAIQNAIVDAKGDLIGATAADTPARLAVGTDGQVLTADSTAATGIKWATPTSGSWTLISGGAISSGTSTITYSSISSSYKYLVAVFNTIVHTASPYAYLTVKFNNNSNIYSANTSDSGGGGMGVSGIGYLNPGTPYLDVSLCNTTITIPNYATSGILKGAYTNSIHKENTSYYDMIQAKTISSLTAAITQLDFSLTNSATFTSGNAYLYGVN